MRSSKHYLKKSIFSRRKERY